MSEPIEMNEQEREVYRLAKAAAVLEALEHALAGAAIPDTEWCELEVARQRLLAVYREMQEEAGA